MSDIECQHEKRHLCTQRGFFCPCLPLSLKPRKYRRTGIFRYSIMRTSHSLNPKRGLICKYWKNAITWRPDLSALFAIGIYLYFDFRHINISEDLVLMKVVHTSSKITSYDSVGTRVVSNWDSYGKESWWHVKAWTFI